MGNFDFLSRHDDLLATLGRRAESYCLDDPNTAIVKLRQYLERLVGLVVTNNRWSLQATDSLLDGLKLAERRGWMDRGAASYAHDLRRAGNEAVHELQTSVGNAIHQLRNARRLAIWYEATYGDQEFRPGPFRVPSPPPDASSALNEAIARQESLEAELEATLSAGDAARAALQVELEERARLLARPQVALHSSLVASLDQVSPDQMAQVRDALRRFRHEADPAGLEPFGPPMDPALCWVPLTAECLLVAAVAPDESLLMALWVDEPERATEWARDHVVEVNATTGHLQVFRPTAPVTGGGALFEDIPDEELLACGVPPLLLPAVRALDDETSLREVVQYLPDETAETLLGIIDGASPEEAQAEAGLVTVHPDIDVNPNDFATALSHPASRRQFVEVVDDEALAAVLDAPFDTWRTFLHPSQARVVRMRANGPIRVLGGAGTGKTIALLHRAVLLARERFAAPEDRLLVTTFTRNLAGELRGLIDSFAPDVASRIDVAPLHAFARRLLVRQGSRVYEPISDAQRRRIIAEASRAEDPEGRVSLEFLMTEWRTVIVRFGLRDRDAYLRHGRVGRGQRLGRRGRNPVWKILNAARAGMEAEGLAELDRLAHDAALLLNAVPSLRRHRAVLADEAQDFGVDGLRLLRAATPPGPDDMFLVGDGHQRLYGAPVTLLSCGIDVRGRGARLRLNYRTTEAIRGLAQAALAGYVADDLDGGTDSLAGYRSLRQGAPPEWLWHDDKADSHARIAELVEEWVTNGVAPETVCVAARSRREVETLGQALRGRGLDIHPLDAAPRPGVRLSTFHRLKGTEFTRVVLASVCEGGIDGTAASERCLLYVAATRARDRLVLTGWGAPSGLLAPEST